MDLFISIVVVNRNLESPAAGKVRDPMIDPRNAHVTLRAVTSEPPGGLCQQM